MKEYIDLANKILEKGNYRGDRTGTGTVSIFGPQLRFDLTQGFPLLTTKKMFVRGIIEELLWFLNGDTNNNILVDKNVHIWDEWALQNRRELTIPERVEILYKNNPALHTDEDVQATVSNYTEAEWTEYLDAQNVQKYERLEGDGDLGPVYGEQWRSWKGKVIGMSDVTPTSRDISQMHFTGTPVREKIDQIQMLIDGLKKKPFSRRHIVSAWNVEDLPDESISPQENVKNGKMALAPCHCLFQFYVREMDVNDRIREWNAHNPENELDMNLSDSEIMADLDARNAPKYRLDCQLYQRSADYILGVPFNIASYALFTMMVAQCVNMLPGEFIHTFGDCHIYKNHIETYIASQMDNTPYELPTMVINPEKKDIFSFTIDDFKLDDYQSHKKIDYPISI